MFDMEDILDFDEIMDARAEQRKARAQRCQCGSDLPGTCPGPAACPHADNGDDDEEE